nr:CD276 antigen homolog [Chelonoidis abingdonii]
MAILRGRRAGTMGLGGLLIPLLVVRVAQSQLIVSVGPSPVRAMLGSDVLLPCSFTVGETISLPKFYLAWARGAEKVAEYLREKPTQQPKVKLFLEELSKGNCSLGLRIVRVEDEGRYTSTLIYTPDRSEQHLELQVTAAPRLSIPQQLAGTGTETSFPCHVWGFYPQDITVTWLRDRRVLTDATRSAPQRNPDGTFNLTLTYTFTPTASDSGSIFSCRVTHAALAQPLQEEFALDVTGADTAPSKAITGVCIALLLVMVAGLVIYYRRRRRAWKGPSSAVETPSKAPARSREKMCSEDTVLMGNDGVSDSGEGSEQQPLLPAQGQEQSETQQQDGVQGTAGSNSGSKASDVSARASSWNMQRGPEAERPSLNTEPSGDIRALDEERVGAASPQAQPEAEVAFPAQPQMAVEEGETDLSQQSQEVMLPMSQPGKKCQAGRGRRRRKTEEFRRAADGQKGEAPGEAWSWADRRRGSGGGRSARRRRVSVATGQQDGRQGRPAAERPAKSWGRPTCEVGGDRGQRRRGSGAREGQKTAKVAGD